MIETCCDSIKTFRVKLVLFEKNLWNDSFSSSSKKTNLQYMYNRVRGNDDISRFPGLDLHRIYTGPRQLAYTTLRFCFSCSWHAGRVERDEDTGGQRASPSATQVSGRIHSRPPPSAATSITTITLHHHHYHRQQQQQLQQQQYNNNNTTTTTPTPSTISTTYTRQSTWLFASGLSYSRFVRCLFIFI